MDTSTIWWLLAGSAIAVELVTGTFYLLMLALGFTAGALSAYMGVAIIGQMLMAAAIGGGSVAVWHWRRSQSPAPLAANARQFTWYGGMLTARPVCLFAARSGRPLRPIQPRRPIREISGLRNCSEIAWLSKGSKKPMG